MPGSIWTTELGHNIHVNLSQENMMKMKETCKICFISDNPGVNDKTNTDFYETIEQDNKECTIFKDSISAVTADGENVTGKIIHIVHDNHDRWTFQYDTDWFLVRFK